MSQPPRKQNNCNFTLPVTTPQNALAHKTQVVILSLPHFSSHFSLLYLIQTNTKLALAESILHLYLTITFQTNLTPIYFIPLQ